jgi:hypothetical protein
MSLTSKYTAGAQSSTMAQLTLSPYHRWNLDKQKLFNYTLIKLEKRFFCVCGFPFTYKF